MSCFRPSSPRHQGAFYRYSLRILLAVVSLVVAQPLFSAPIRIASLNLCTDQLLLALAEPGQIASVTFLAQHEISSYMAPKAMRHHVNHGQAEEIIPLKPDLVVALFYTAPSIIRLLERLEIPVELFPFANTIEEVEASIRRMAKLVGSTPRGEAIINAMAAKQISSVIPALDEHSPRGIYYEPNGYTAGPDTLKGELMRIAGWHNIASELGIDSFGVVGLESLVLAKPDRFILSPYAPGTHSLGQRLLTHPAIAAVTSGRPPLIIPTNLWICAGPMNTEAVIRLVQGR